MTILPATPSRPQAPRRPHTTPYRHDLDGLRGVAITLVVIFHIWSGRVSGGVDVFLTLSGFFFVGSLLRSADQPGRRLRPLHTLWRTVRRLVPALAVVSGFVYLAWSYNAGPIAQAVVAGEVRAGLLYTLNQKLAADASDYAAAGASISPVQHLWSMSVQGQFYLLAIVTVALVVLIRRHLCPGSAITPPVTVLMAVAAPASFVHAIRLGDVHQAANYYSSFSRWWEILVGALLAVAIPHLVLPRTVRAVFAVTGLVMLLSGGVLIDGAASFPGPAALFPVGAAVLLILAGARRATDPAPTPRTEPVTWVLATRPLRTLGDLAYSLYLWHWPLLILDILRTEDPAMGPLRGLRIFAVALVLAWLTHRFVELPLRARRAADLIPNAGTTYRRALALGVTGIMVALLLATRYADEVSTGDRDQLALDADQLVHSPADYPGALVYTDGAAAPGGIDYLPNPTAAVADLATTAREGCITSLEGHELVMCEYGDLLADRTIALVGGSHSEHWIDPLDELGQTHGFRIVTLLKSACLLYDGPSTGLNGREIAECTRWSDAAWLALMDIRPDFVFVTATRPDPAGGDSIPPEYIATWRRLQALGFPVLAIRDTPWLSRPDRDRPAPDCLAQGRSPYQCGVPRADRFSPSNPAIEALAMYPDLTAVGLLDLTDAFCDEQVCPAVIGNIIVYHDGHHMTRSFARTLAPALSRRLGPLTGWW